MDNIARMGQVLERFLRRFKRPPTRKEMHRMRDKVLVTLDTLNGYPYPIHGDAPEGR